MKKLQKTANIERKNIKKTIYPEKPFPTINQ